MPIATFYPTSNANAENGGWTNPQNVYADDAVYATAASLETGVIIANRFATFRNGSGQSVDTVIPSGSTINSVRVEAEASINSLGLGVEAFSFRFQPYISGTPYGSEFTVLGNAMSTSPTLYTIGPLTDLTRAQLLDASLSVRARWGRDSAYLGSRTASLDFVRVIIDYTTPQVINAPGSDVAVEVGSPESIQGFVVEASGSDIVVEAGTPESIQGFLLDPAATEISIEVGTPKVVYSPSPVKSLQDELARERDALMGLRGNIHYEPRLFLSNILADELTELPGVLGASVNVDNDREYTWELKLDCLPTDAFDPLRDWVLVALDVSTDMDPPKRYYLGLYRFDFPGGIDEPEGSIWQLTGMSPEFLLMRDDINELVPIPAQRFILREVRDIASRKGIPLQRLTMPWSEDLQTAASKVYGALSNLNIKTWLQLVNALLAAGGFHHLQTDNLGSPVARKQRLPQVEAPAVFYGPRDREISLPVPGNFLGKLKDLLPAYKGNDMILYEPISREPDYGRFANEVTVESADVSQQGTEPMPADGVVAETVPTNSGPPVRAIVRNRDPKSALSVLPSGLGYVVSKTETLDHVVSRRVCKRIARRVLMTSATHYNKRSFGTMLDPRRTFDEVYLVEATNGQGVRIMNGRWQCLSWSLPLPVGGAPDLMTHNVGRDELITDLEEIG